jgi:hypothetical protein
MPARIELSLGQRDSSFAHLSWSQQRRVTPSDYVTVHAALSWNPICKEFRLNRIMKGSQIWIVLRHVVKFDVSLRSQLHDWLRSNLYDTIQTHAEVDGGE